MAAQTQTTAAREAAVGRELEQAHMEAMVEQPRRGAQAAAARGRIITTQAMAVRVRVESAS